jgi:hypothetical protein
MCGRYRRTTAEEEIARQFHIPIPPQLDFADQLQHCAEQNVLAIRRNPETGERCPYTSDLEKLDQLSIRIRSLEIREGGFP